MSKCVSILLTCYNEINFIERTLESVIGEADEIILSDNASTDGTSDICQSYASKYPEIKYIRHKENMGASKNIRFCEEQSMGKYFRYVMGHDMISHGSNQSMVKLMEENSDVVMVYPKNVMMLNSDYSVADFVYMGNFGRDLMSDSPFVRVESYLRYHCHDSISFGMYKKEVASQIYNYAISSGYYLGLTQYMASRGKIMGDDSVDSVFYRMIPGSKRETGTSLEDQNLREFAKKLDPNVFYFPQYCVFYAWLQELASRQDAPKKFEKKIFNMFFERNINGLPNLDEIPGLLPEKRAYAEYVYNKIKGKSLELRNIKRKFKKTLKMLVAIILPYGIIRPLSVFKVKKPGSPFFDSFHIKWLLPFGCVRVVEKLFFKKRSEECEHVSYSLRGGGWW
ncbi:MAG: glycosyltransferase [Prevotella sp.]|jgi:glycosyltransferase involved in cell wall biosynthesis|nr:glycosyltransferase [Prevotella sp.]